MWRLWCILGAAVWLGTIIVSASMNYIAGYEFGRSVTEARLYATLGLSADVWKAIGPLFIVTFWRNNKRAPASLAGTVWICCFLFAVSAALGLAARNRSAIVGEREDLRLGYNDLDRQLTAAEQRRDELDRVSSPAEKEADIAAALARPLPGGTVGSLSASCTEDHPRTRDACAKIAVLKGRLAAAQEAAELDAEISDLMRRRDIYRAKGARREADPQSRLISALSDGFIAPKDVGLLLILLLGTVVELVSAFAPVILHEFAQSARAAGERRVEPVSSQPSMATSIGSSLRPSPEEEANVYEYLAARVVSDADGRVAVGASIADYETWCLSQRIRATPAGRFIALLEDIAASQLRGAVFRQGGDWRGFTLRSTPRLKRIARTRG